MSDTKDASKDTFHPHEKYHHFRILVIGRVNAGKTTLLKCVCNTTKEPCIYDERKNLLEPSEDRGLHDITRAFSFTNNPQFIFHDSPGIEAGDETQLDKVRSFISDRSKSTDVKDQLHAIWYCFDPNKSRLLLDTDKRFFEEGVAVNVPVIAIATKFDDLVAQVFNPKKGLERSYEEAKQLLHDNLEVPLQGFKFPPRAFICIEEMQDDNSNHQEQVKELIQKTADSLDNLALKMLFVSVQQNNLELCVRYAIKYVVPLNENLTLNNLISRCLMWFSHSYSKSYNYGEKENEEIRAKYYVAYGKYKHEGYGSYGAAGYAAKSGAEYRKVYPQFSTTCNRIEEKIKIIFDLPSVEMLAALLICAENSFWHQDCNFLTAFSTAFKLYESSGTMKRVGAALNQLGNYPEDNKGRTSVVQYFQAKNQNIEQEKYKTALIELILAHRLFRSI